MNEITYAEALAAHAGTSWTPEARAQQEIASHRAQLEADRAALERHADAPEKRAVLETEWARYAAGLTERVRRYLHSRARVVSWTVAGPSRFPAERMRRRGEVMHRCLEELLAYRERALAAIVRALHPEWRPIMAGDADAEARLVEKIAQAEARQARMRAVNAAIRGARAGGVAAQVSALRAIGYEQGAADILLKSDAFGNIGHPAYELTNNAANIRRMRARLEQVRRQQAEAPTAAEGSAVRLEDDPPANRVRLRFPGKPGADVRARLKAAGWRWAPSLGCWHAHRNPWSLELGRRVAGLGAP